MIPRVGAQGNVHNGECLVGSRRKLNAFHVYYSKSTLSRIGPLTTKTYG